MRIFYLYRTVDESGVSGTGIVAEGVQFTNGKCAMAWLTDYTSIAIYENIGDVNAIHGHNGMTKILWEEDLDDTQQKV